MVGNGPSPVAGSQTSTSSGTPSKLGTRAASSAVGQKRTPRARLAGVAEGCRRRGGRRRGEDRAQGDDDAGDERAGAHGARSYCTRRSSGPGALSIQRLMHRRLLVPTVVAVIIAVAYGWAELVGYLWTDYELANAVPLGALVHGDLATFFHAAPIEGPSLLLHAPFALASWLWGGSSMAIYRMVAVPGLLAGVILGVVLWALREERQPAARWSLLVVLLASGNPLTLKALEVGHPEELLGAALCVGRCPRGSLAAPVAGRRSARPRAREQGVGGVGDRPGAACAPRAPLDCASRSPAPSPPCSSPPSCSAARRAARCSSAGGTDAVVPTVAALVAAGSSTATR